MLRQPWSRIVPGIAFEWSRSSGDSVTELVWLAHRRFDFRALEITVCDRKIIISSKMGFSIWNREFSLVG